MESRIRIRFIYFYHLFKSDTTFHKLKNNSERYKTLEFR